MPRTTKERGAKTPSRAAPSLADYRRKRRPEATNEPFGGELPGASSEGTLTGAYVVHLHDATRLHYDVRLEVGGVLTSFAVPRGPSLDPDEKTLAVRTEDHPIEYLDFEDVIPPGLYGAGAMIAWDRGEVDYLEGPAEAELASGKLHVELRGLKLRGRFAFVKLARSAKGNEWLLFKKADPYASKERDLRQLLPRSVYSGLTVQELASRAEVAAAREAHAFALGARRLSAGEARALASPARSPLVMPRAASDDRRAVTGSAWVYDADLEGVRVLASRDGDRVALHLFEGASAQSIEAFYPEVVRALRALPASRVVFDGELVAFGADGHPNLRALAQRAPRIASGDALRAITRTPVVLVAKDLLALGDADLRGLPLGSRRALLAELLPDVGFLRGPVPLEGRLASILAFCTEHDVLGVTAKKRTSPYSVDAAKTAWVHVASGVAPRSRAVIDHRASSTDAALRRVTVTNRAKVFWPEERYTKGDLCDYYAAIADVILPYLVDRPVILVRYPDGIEGKSFFQWNVPPGMPSWMRTISVTDVNDEPRRGFLIDDASALLYVANLACIPLHILGSRMARLASADFLTLDFDVKQSELRHAITLAQRLHEHLDAMGLPSFPKTSGQSGLHVLVPLGEGQTFETARALAELLGRLLVDELPKIATMERVVARRGDRVYVDTGQTGPTRAIVAPYSVRAVPGATVSTPLEWSEVVPGLEPRDFTIATVAARVAAQGDPMRGMLSSRPDVAAAVGKLAERVARVRAKRG